MKKTFNLVLSLVLMAFAMAASAQNNAALTVLSPANGSEIATLAPGDEVATVELNLEGDYYQLCWEYRCPDDPDFYFPGYVFNPTSGKVQLLNNSEQTVEFNKGRNYTLTIGLQKNGWDPMFGDDAVTINLVGNGAEPEKTSEVSIVSITPENGATLDPTKDAEVKITFSEAISEFKAWIPGGFLGTTTYLAPTTEDNITWTVKMSHLEFESVDGPLYSIAFCFSAQDQAGLFLPGENSEHSYNLMYLLGEPEPILKGFAGSLVKIVSPEPLSTLRKLYKVEIGVSGYQNVYPAENLTYNYGLEPTPYIMDENQKVVSVYTDLGWQGMDYDVLTAMFEPVTEDGTYTLVIPAGSIGVKEDPYDYSDDSYELLADDVYAVFTVDSSIEAPKTDWTYNITPADKAEVETLAHVYVEFPNIREVMTRSMYDQQHGPSPLNDDDDIDPGFGVDPEEVPAITLTNNKTQEVIELFAANWVEEMSEWGFPEPVTNKLDLWFDAVPAGNYTLTIPAGAIITVNLEDDLVSNEASIVAEYTSAADAESVFEMVVVPADGDYNAIVADDLSCVSLNFVTQDYNVVFYPEYGQLYDKAVAPSEEPYVLGADGTKYEINGVEIEINYETWTYVQNYKFDGASLADGEYKLVIPQGTYFVSRYIGATEICNQIAEIVVPFTKGNTTDIIMNVSVGKADVMYNIAGQRVSDAKGMVIVGGKKYNVK